MDRQKEVRELLKMDVEDIKRKAKGKVIIFENLDELHKHFARTIADEIKVNNKRDRIIRLILPVGPVAQYPILAEIINEEKISLKKCYFFYMDEYADNSGIAIHPTHPLSFKGEMQNIFFSKIDRKLNIPSNQIIFPDHLNIGTLKDKIERVGGIDTCYGGIGIHGHVAFNEPEPNVKYTDPRLVYFNQYSITINAIRSEVGGDLVNFPTKALTLGMNQIRKARRVRLYCRNDIKNIDWANLVLRIALFGEPGDDYPVTHLRDHKNFVVGTTLETASKPKFILPLLYKK